MLEEIGGEGDRAWLEEREGAGASEGKVALFVPLLNRGSGRVGLRDGTHVGGAHFEHKNGSEVVGSQLREYTLVLPEVGEVAPQGDGRDGEEGAVEETGLGRRAGGGKMESVVVDGTEAGEDQGAFLVAGCEFLGSEEGGKVEALALHENRVRLGEVVEAEVSAIGREHCRIGSDGAGFRF